MSLQYFKVDSSNLKEVAYDQDRQTLRVRFKAGTEYEYAGVPFRTFGLFLAAESHGVFLNTVVKARYPFTKIESDASVTYERRGSPALEHIWT